jgi:hypothetical protein
MKGVARIAPLGFILLLLACKSQRPVVQGTTRELPPRSPAELLTLMIAGRPNDIRHYNAKAELEMSDSVDSQSAKARIQLVVDSAVWIKVMGPLGIEGGRALVTSDSLKVLDTFHNKFWIGDTATARARFGIQPGLSLFQEALLGLPIGLDPQDRYKSDREDGQYTLTSKEKRRFRRAAEDLAPDDTLPDDRDMKERRLERTLRRAEKKDAIVLKYWIEPDSFRVTRVLMTDLAHDQQADVRYLSRTTVNGRSLPDRLTLSLSDASKRFSGALELERITLGEPAPMVFRIPEDCEPMAP